MSKPRLLGLLATALCVAVTAVSAQQPPLPPGVKLPPQIKPGMPPGGPLPKPGPGDPKGKNPLPPAPGPGTPSFPSVPGGPPSMPGAGKPAEKKDAIKWPEKVNGKTLAEVHKEMKSNSDPAIREAAARMLPLFGPKGREVAGQDLVDLMTRDPDWNVRVAAVEAGVTVIWNHLGAYDNPQPDQLLQNGLNAFMACMSSTQMGVRVTATAAVGAVGPYMRIPFSNAISRLTTQAKDPSSYQLRRIAVASIASIGQGGAISDSPESRQPPDTAAVTALLEILRNDACSVVQKEAVTGLIGVGPVAGNQQKKWRADLESIIKNEKDKSLVLWARVCILRNDPAGVEGNTAHMDAVAKVLESPEPAGRLEACQAIALLGEEAKGKLQELLNMIQNDKEEPAIVAAAIMAAATMKSQVKIILPILQKTAAAHKSEEVKKIAAEGILYVTGQKKN